MNCARMYCVLFKAGEKAKIAKGEISEVVAKVMAVAAGQKRLQVQEVIQDHEINLEAYE
jgi:transcription antitermination factor NusG